MTDKPKVDVIKAEQVRQAGDIAKRQVLSQSTHDILMNLTEDQIKRVNKQYAEVIKGSSGGPECWVHGPAQIEFLSVSDKRFSYVGSLAGIMDKKIQRVDAQLIKGTRLLVIQAARPNNLEALEVNRYKGSSSAWFNVIDLLSEEGLTVETGWKERYKVAFVPEGSALWPGLVIDLGAPIDRRRETVGKKGEAKKTGDKGPQGKGDDKKNDPQGNKDAPGASPDEPLEEGATPELPEAPDTMEPDVEPPVEA